jgi:glycerol-3-phosphate dehydrogenase (NAD(P)+)
MTFGILGNGSWGTALAKMLTDNGHAIHWWFRSEAAVQHLVASGHNPQYLSQVNFNTSLLHPTTDEKAVVAQSDCVIVAVPSAYADAALQNLSSDAFQGKKVLSAIKGILPAQNLLLNDLLKKDFNLPLEDYFAVMGPCHAEEVAAKKLSYLTFSGIDEAITKDIAAHFATPYISTVVNQDIYGVQFAAILKNIYAVGAGMAHGLDYGDNFLSVLIANSADEMAGFLRKAGIVNAEVGYIEHIQRRHGSKEPLSQGRGHTNYAASVYLGDLLVTCYSLHSRNRSFGNMIGKGYSVKAAQLEMSMVAEGYNASRCMYLLNENIKAEMPIAETVYRILWEHLPAREGFGLIEEALV